MITITGVAASPGVAIGPAYIHHFASPLTERRQITKEDVKSEVIRMRAAYKKTEDDLTKAEVEIKNILGAEYAQLLTAHKAILQDPAFKKMVLGKIQNDLLSAENAVHSAVEEIIVQFDSLEDEFFRERKNDVFDVAKRLFNHLSGGGAETTFKPSKPSSILVVHNLLPSDTLTLRDNSFVAFVTDIGGKTSHTALLAQSLELPAVVGLSTASKTIQNDDMLIVDGEKGILIVNPDAETLTHYKKIQREIKKSETLLKTINDLPFITTDGKRVQMMINYDPRMDSKETRKLKTDGLGLLRTEFLYLGREIPPSEEEQIELYAPAAKKFDMRPVNIRLADLGGDKVHSLKLGDYSEELNPFMGCRGIRFLLKYPELLTSQLRAIVKTSAQVNAQIKIIIPMVSRLEEVLETKGIFAQVLQECSLQGIYPKNKIDLGIMVEVPSIALALDFVLPHIDFVSIGTNDLIQYMVAVDRVNEEVADLYDPYHPGVIRIINDIVQSCQQKHKSVSVCGELASDPAIVPLLIGLGVDTLSTTPRMFLRIKNRLRTISYDTCANFAQAALLMGSSEEIKKLSLTIVDENS